MKKKGGKTILFGEKTSPVGSISSVERPIGKFRFGDLFPDSGKASALSISSVYSLVACDRADELVPREVWRMVGVGGFSWDRYSRALNLLPIDCV